MTLTADALSVPDWPEGALYYSPQGTYGFQIDGVAEALLKTDAGDATAGHLVVWDTGLGKSHYAMVLATILFEDGLIDAVLVICERIKLGEWVDDFSTFTKLEAINHHGTGRKERFDKTGVPQVLASTYETAVGEMCAPGKPPGKRGTKSADAWLSERYRGLRVLVIFDEATQL